MRAAWVVVLGLVAGVAQAKAPERVIRAGDALRPAADAARDACSFTSGAWTCDPAALAVLRTTAEYAAVDAAGASVTATPTARGQCVAWLDVELTAVDRDVPVDWTRVVFLRDGQAIPALPGFARGVTDNLAQRQSFVPAGSVMRERVVPSGGACLFDLRTTQALELVMPVGRDGSSVRWSMTRAVAPETEASALRMLLVSRLWAAGGL